nr:hypothetical protein [Tanacetum cinerariifolium]
MPEMMRDALYDRILMEHRDDSEAVVFTSQAWRRLFDTKRPLVRELILEFLSTLRFEVVLLDLDTPSTIQFQLDFQVMPEMMRDALYDRILMEHRDDSEVVVFTSQAWRRLFDTRRPLVRELILEFLSTLRFEVVLLDLDTPSTIQFQLGRAMRRMSQRQFILALGLHTAEEMELP